MASSSLNQSSQHVPLLPQSIRQCVEKSIMTITHKGQTICINEQDITPARHVIQIPWKVALATDGGEVLGLCHDCGLIFPVLGTDRSDGSVQFDPVYCPAWWELDFTLSRLTYAPHRAAEYLSEYTISLRRLWLASERYRRLVDGSK